MEKTLDNIKQYLKWYSEVYGSDFYFDADLKPVKLSDQEKDKNETLFMIIPSSNNVSKTNLISFGDLL